MIHREKKMESKGMSFECFLSLGGERAMVWVGGLVVVNG